MTQTNAKQTQSKQSAKAAAAATEAADTATAAAFEVPGVLRDMAEQTASRARQNYDAYKVLAEEATDAMEDALTSANKGAGELQRQALVSAKAQLDAGFDFAEKMLAARSLSEALELQSAFVRQQFDVMQSSFKDFQELSVRYQQETSRPFAANVNKVMESWRRGA